MEDEDLLECLSTMVESINEIKDTIRRIDKDLDALRNHPLARLRNRAIKP